MKSVLKRILDNEATAGVVLIVAAMVAMFLANHAATQQIYQTMLAIPVEFRFGPLDISKNLLHWINDALMALFFLMIGLEVKHELISGALATRQRAMFPLIAALGGMIAPGAIFALLNHSNPLALRGWAIPTATDIAFALGILALLGRRVPPALKIFLMALAVIDDLGAILIIAFFYTQDLAFIPLCFAVGAVSVLALLNRFGVRNLPIYMLAGLILWVAILKSGVHATLAGVILGLFVPLKEQEGHSPATFLSHSLAPWIRWLILPLFAFANAGISLNGVSSGDLCSGIPLGIIFGLFIGKPLGITLICWLAVKLRVAALPERTQMRDIAAIGVLCGIGFTMSIFIASLAFDADHPEMIKLAKLGILTGSAVAAMVGYTLLRIKFR